tara:strand:- start:213 stop:530 length:318 start_codon:yes stop_codon:yes gene_type:complete
MRQLGAPRVLVGHGEGVPAYGLSFSRDGRFLLSCGGDGKMLLWDCESKEGIGPLAMFNQNSQLLHNQQSNTYAATGKLLNHPVYSVAWSPAGYYFVSGGRDGIAR